MRNAWLSSRSFSARGRQFAGRGKVLALLLVGALVVLIGWDAVAAQGLSEQAARIQAASLGQQSNQLFQGDLRVERGQVMSGDTVVYDGDVWMDPEGRIDGNLVVFSGDVNIAEGASVEGNLDLFSGDATIAGTVNGNLVVWSGDVNLRATARIAGDISILSGEVSRAGDAFVGGAVTIGPGLNLRPPTAFSFENWRGFGQDSAFSNSVARPFSFMQWVIGFMARLLGAVLFTAFAAVVVGLIVHVRPEAVARVQTRMVEKTAASFVIGLSVNLVLVFLGGLLAITVCLLPIALVPMLALLALNVLGWAALSQWVGQRIQNAIDRPMESWMAAALGAVLITVGFAFLWALGGFFRGIGNTVLLFTASFGAGAILYPWVMRMLRPARAQPARARDARTATVDPPQAWVDETVSERRPDYTPASDAVVRPAHASALDPDVAVETPPELDARVLTSEDDFTSLRGVGPVLDGRLKDAGIRTFGQLATLTPAAVAEIAGWSEERVVRSEIIEQAQAAAE